jgi:hypothetical protein
VLIALAQKLISIVAAERLRQVTYNVQGLAKNWYLKFVQLGTAAKFIIKCSLLLMSPNL